MAKERTDLEKQERKERKKAKAEKRSEKDGVHKSSSKKDRISKKEKKPKEEEGDAVPPLSDEPKEAEEEPQSPRTNGHVTAALLDTLAVEKPTPEPEVVEKDAKSDGHVVSTSRPPIPIGALVPFANPLADEKVGKKVLKVVKKAAKNKSLKRGVKEVVKSLRKSPSSTTTTTTPTVVILAADISPMDVISHIPVLCEDHNVPYIFVTSRAELGAASATKRPTSVVMVCRERGGKRKEGEKVEGEEEFAESFKDLAKVVERESRGVRV